MNGNDSKEYDEYDEYCTCKKSLKDSNKTNDGQNEDENKKLSQEDSNETQFVDSKMQERNKKDENINKIAKQIIHDENPSELLRSLQSKNDFELTNDVFNFIYKSNTHFYTKVIQEWFEKENPVALHKSRKRE